MDKRAAYRKSAVRSTDQVIHPVGVTNDLTKADKPKRKITFADDEDDDDDKKKVIFEIEEEKESHGYSTNPKEETKIVIEKNPPKTVAKEPSRIEEILKKKKLMDIK
jgi:hypothetical protein